MGMMMKRDLSGKALGVLFLEDGATGTEAGQRKAAGAIEFNSASEGLAGHVHGGRA